MIFAGETNAKKSKKQLFIKCIFRSYFIFLFECSLIFQQNVWFFVLCFVSRSYQQKIGSSFGISIFWFIIADWESCNQICDSLCFALLQFFSSEYSKFVTLCIYSNTLFTIAHGKRCNFHFTASNTNIYLFFTREYSIDLIFSQKQVVVHNC